MVKRDKNGRFLKGTSGNPKGRSPKDREERYYEITMSACTFQDWKKIVNKAVEQAKRGDNQARQWLSNYLIGKPEDTLNLKGDTTISILEIINPDADNG